jgi:hypothetical protein
MGRGHYYFDEIVKNFFYQGAMAVSHPQACRAGQWVSSCTRHYGAELFLLLMLQKMPGM